MKISKIICGIRGHRPFSYSDERLADQKALKEFREELRRTQAELAELRNKINEELNDTAPLYATVPNASTLAATTSVLHGTLSSNPSWSILNSNASSMSSHLSGLSTGTFSLKTAQAHDNHDFNVTYKICSRCMTLYADTKFKESICDARKVPALKEFIDWKEQQAKEEKIRESNESVRDLYRDYRVMMKLSSGENNSD